MRNHFPSHADPEERRLYVEASWRALRESYHLMTRMPEQSVVIAPWWRPRWPSNSAAELPVRAVEFQTG